MNSPTLQSPRLHLDCNDNWTFRLATTSQDTWEPVTLPHTYNTIDGTRGGAYYRNRAFYRRKIALPDIATRRYFLHFDGCSLSAHVSLDDRSSTTHRGGFTGFFVEIDRSRLNRPHSVEVGVEVDNSRQDDLAPLAGDFTLFGGINRPIQLISAPETCFTPTENGTEGVWIATQNISVNQAQLTCCAHITSTNSNDHSLSLIVIARDAAGNEVSRAVAPVSGTPNAPLMPSTKLVIDHPHLWQGRNDPYLYEIVWELWNQDHCIDRISRRVGLRFIERDAAGHFSLNGKPIRLHGVCKQQDVAGKGSALTFADHRRDIEMICELGANAVRLAHYPYPQEVYDLCDQHGLLVWTEIPLVNALRNTPQFYDTTTRQLGEMIGQLGHHASIFTWGIYNELYSGETDQSTEMVQQLNALAKVLDPTRPTACAGYASTPVELRNITDLLGTNAYPGWYHSKPEDMAPRIVEWNLSGGKRGLCVSEYGAGANPWQHEEPVHSRIETTGFWHPEEWQSYCHERHYESIRTSNEVWGSFVWVMFDFYSDRRNEGGIPGINNKGLVTIDRALFKDAYYFYQAHWSNRPVLHICSKRNARPHPAPQVIKVYSNAKNLCATLNGQPLGDPKVSFGVAHEFSLPTLAAGPHEIHVTGTWNETKTADTRQFFIHSSSGQPTE